MMAKLSKRVQIKKMMLKLSDKAKFNIDYSRHLQEMSDNKWKAENAYGEVKLNAYFPSFKSSSELACKHAAEYAKQAASRAFKLYPELRD